MKFYYKVDIIKYPNDYLLGFIHGITFAYIPLFVYFTLKKLIK